MEHLNDCSRGLGGSERVGKYLEFSGAFFSDGSGERVDGWSDLDVFETGFFEHLLPARTGQPTRDSAGPKVDISQCLDRHRTAVRDVSELEHPAWS